MTAATAILARRSLERLSNAAALDDVERNEPAPRLRSLLANISPVRPLQVSPQQVSNSARAVLRPLVASDCVEFLRVMRLNRDRLARFFPLSRLGESDLDAFARQLRLSSARGPRPDFRRFAFSPDGRIIGSFNVNSITRGLEFRAEVTAWVSSEFEGAGYATEILGSVIELAFEDLSAGGLGLHRLDALVCPDNERSSRLFSRLGFVSHDPPVRVQLDLEGRWVMHELVTLHASLPSPQPVSLTEFKLLPAHLRQLMASQLAVIERSDPDDVLHRAAS